jgi:hypothetical protein
MNDRPCNIDNFLKLLFAIENSDDYKEQSYGVIGVYDTKDNDKLIAIFNNVSTLSNFFKVSRACVKSRCLCRKSLLKSRYRLERFKDESLSDNNLENEILENVEILTNMPIEKAMKVIYKK